MGMKKASIHYRMFNGYVRNPRQMIVMVVVVGLFLLSTAIVVTFFLLYSKDMPSLVQNEVIIEKMQKEHETIRFITTKGNYSVSSMLVNDYSSLEKAVHDKETFHILSHPFWGMNEENHVKLWGIIGSNGAVYLNPETVKVHQLNNLKVMMYNAWGLVMIYIIFTFLGWYFLSNAPRYPHLASLFVKKEWRNF